MDYGEFQRMVAQKGEELYRDMPWRQDPSPYKVWVSELMLQQTQVNRVIPKFIAFMQRFPDITALAESSLADVLVLWSGLGYNRRAKFLWQAALEISLRFDAQLPSTQKDLVSLPGIGPNTAAAILNYAYQQPTPFVETNIRTVYFHHFFHGRTDVTDKELLELVERTMPFEGKEQPEQLALPVPGALRKTVGLSQYGPREWYWALMDYGAHLKATAGGRLDVSKHYKKQSPLAGSMREMRGQIIRELTAHPLAIDALKRAVSADERFAPALEALSREGMIEESAEGWCLSDSKK